MTLSPLFLMPVAPARATGQIRTMTFPFSSLPSPSHGDFDPAALPGRRVRIPGPLKLDCGGHLRDYWIAWQTYGQLNADKSNAVFICHALTGDQFVAENHPVTGKPGWWETVVGDGKVIDTRRFFVICANVLGGCMGSAGPRTINPATGKPYALDFPVITINDMARAHKALIDHLGIPKIFLIIGGSMGGMQALAFAALFPRATGACAAIATAARHSAQNIAFGEVGRQAILADPAWSGGGYIVQKTLPSAGLSVARMAAHITYLSEAALQRKFGRKLQDRPAVSFGFDADFQVESYLRHQGHSFVARFDPNSYLYITRAIDYFDLAADLGGGRLADAFGGTPTRFFACSFTSDWLYPTSESRHLVRALAAAGAPVSFVEIESDKGHDAFLLDEPEFHRQLAGFIRGCEEMQVRRDEGAKVRGCEGSGGRGFGDTRVRGRESSRGFLFPRTSEPPNPRTPEPLAPELQLIANIIPANARVLDVGCGDGVLLDWLRVHKDVTGCGLEIDRKRVEDAIARGLPVIQGDADTDLSTYPDDAFDVAVLNRTLTELREPLEVVRALRRLAFRVIVAVPNFAHWRARLSLGVRGRAPVTPALPHEWYNSPNIRFCALDDFAGFAEEAGMRVEQALFLDAADRPLPPLLRPAANLLAASGLYVLERV